MEKITPRICNLSEIQIASRLYRNCSMRSQGVSELSWSTSNWEKLSLVNDEEVIKLMKAKVYEFSDSVLRVGKMSEYPKSNNERENRLKLFNCKEQYRELDGSLGTQWSSSEEYSQDTPRCRFSNKSKSL